jgi:hypothetical protein
MRTFRNAGGEESEISLLVDVGVGPKCQRTGALQDASRTREPWCSRQHFEVRRPAAAIETAQACLPSAFRAFEKY